MNKSPIKKSSLKICVTGANGFIGAALCVRLQASGHDVVGLVRRLQAHHDDGQELIQLNDICDIKAAHLQDVDLVIHTAGLAHQDVKDMAQFNAVNLLGSVAVGEACIAANVPRLINLSSTKAVGEGSVYATTQAAPESPYGRSKYEAELALTSIQASSNLDVLNLRIPLVYGQGMKGNFPRLVKLARQAPLLPLSALTSKRHYLGLDTLLDFLEQAVALPKFELNTVQLSDPAPIALGDLLETLAQAQGKQIVSLPMPEFMVTSIARLVLGKKTFNQLFQDCETESTASQLVTGWQATMTTKKAIHQMFVKTH